MRVGSCRGEQGARGGREAADGEPRGAERTAKSVLLFGNRTDRYGADSRMRERAPWGCPPTGPARPGVLRA